TPFPDVGLFLLSNQQRHGKVASLKSLVSYTEKLDRVRAPLDSSLHWPEGLKGEEIKKCDQIGTLLSKYNQQYHKLFKDIPLEEVVLKVCSCALQRDLLLQGRLYISPNWLCFHARLFGKDIKVVIPVVSVQMIKKHKMARLLPNGLAITTTSSQKVSESLSQRCLAGLPAWCRSPQPDSGTLPGLSLPQPFLLSSSVQYVFVSLVSRDSVYDVLSRVCTHLQCTDRTHGHFPMYLQVSLALGEEVGAAVGGWPGIPVLFPPQPSSKKSLSVRELPEEPERASLGHGKTLLLPSLQEVLIPEMKWRKVCPASRSLSLPDNILRVPRVSMDSTDGFFPSGKPPGCENAVCEEKNPEEARRGGERWLWDHQFLKVFIVLICLLVMFSSYLAFRISQLEQRLCSLSWDGPAPGRR
ncbi:hypothetical protein MC885_019583, partial [Smutsia gigantea]